MKADLPKREPAWLAQWEQDKVYERLQEKRKGSPAFVLHDGPPYANGHLHLGHALNKILKDIIVRYKSMAGFRAPYVPGWDCHGLPIELQLMKELKVTDKHKVDRTKFREQAKAFAEKFVEIQRQEFKRMGILGDWEHPYLTMDESYKNVIVEVFQQLEAKGYVYRGKKPVYWCSTDETALAEAEVEYENDPGPSIYVAFPLHAPPNFNEDAGGHGQETKAVLWTSGSVSFVIWTTTPWTLPANRAIAINPEERYVLFEDAKTRKKFIVAERRLEDFQKVCELSGKVLDHTPGHTFRGAFAKHPWIAEHYVPVLEAGFVAMDTGTGLVHIAPGHGMEDYQLGIANDLEVYSPVDDRGRFTEEVPEWKGEHVFKANPLILQFLKDKGVLLHSEEITHSYPHCWRCHKPVIFRATEQWFLNIDHEGLRQRLLGIIDKNVQWIPSFGQNRIRGMIESRPDWCLSRQRLWGTEIPASPRASLVPLPQGEGGRRPGEADSDIFDVWFESGVSWAAVLKQRPELQYPADMYLEGSDQHRGWFQTSLIPSVALEGRAPFKSVLTHGFVMDGEGRPMSKSLGNVIAPDEVIKQYGADVLRLWVASSDYAGDVRLSPEILKGLVDNYRKVRNTFRYLLGSLSDFNLADRVGYDKMLDLDRWIMSRLQSEIERAQEFYKKYEFHRVAASLVSFCALDLSGFYLDVLKDRLYCEVADSPLRRSAQTALWYLADNLIRLWAPILSFTADEAWRVLQHSSSVALEDLPRAEEKFQSSQDQISEVLLIRERVLEQLEKARQAGHIKGNLEAKVLLYAQPKFDGGKILKRYQSELPAIFIVSQVNVLGEPILLPDIEYNGVQIKIERALGQKCARCWIYKTDVGSHSRWADVCGRCAGVLDELSKTGKLVTA